MKNITVPNGTLPVGTIVAAKYETCETLYWKFYVITGYTAKRVEIKKIESKITYDDGVDGPHYYDAPKHTQPVITNGFANPIEGAKRVSYKITDSGVMCFNPEQFYRVRGAWNGEPLETYNYH